MNRDFKIQNKWKFNDFIGDQRTAVGSETLTGRQRAKRFNEGRLQAQQSWGPPVCPEQQAWQRRMACCKMQRKPKLVREPFFRFLLANARRNWRQKGTSRDEKFLWLVQNKNMAKYYKSMTSVCEFRIRLIRKRPAWLRWISGRNCTTRWMQI